MEILAIYLLVINVTAFVTMAVDKRRAQARRWRVRESTLFLEAFAGGSLGILMGMRLCRHKTQHKRFTITIPILTAVQLLALLLIALSPDHSL